MFVICNDCKSLIVILYWKSVKGEENMLYVSVAEYKEAIVPLIQTTEFFKDPYYYLPYRAHSTRDKILQSRFNSIHPCDHLKNLCVKGDRGDHFDPALYPNISY